VSANQQLADRIADQLRQSGRLRGFHIEVAVDNGAVELSGQVADRTQHDEALRLTQAIAGVATVRDRLAVVAVPAVTPRPR